MSEGAYDEAIGPGGVPRSHYAELLGVLDRLDLSSLAAALAEGLSERDVTYRLEGKDDPFRLDAVPRLIELEEWAPLAAALSQRVRALDRFVADVYGEREIVTAGVVPARAVDSCDHYEPLAARFPETPVRVGVAGLDIVRDPAGRFLVLEDNVRTPSGFAYVFAAREALDRHLPGRLAEGRVPYEPAIDMLARSLRAAAPEGVGDPSIVLLSDGPSTSAWYEHERLARVLEVPLFEIRDLSVREGRLVARAGETRVPVDVVYLGEEPLLRSVRTYDPGIREHREEIAERIEELVVKPRAGYGGEGVVVGPHAEAGDLRETARAVAERPEDYVAQEMVMLSTHPTVVDDRLEPRHVDLRPFAFGGEDGEVAPGGVTRVALDRGALVVNSSQAGGAKDTWVMA